MAFETGIASGRVDLLTKLRAFAVANSWSELSWNGTDNLTIAGPGTDGFDEIIVKFEQLTNVLSIRGYQYLDGQGVYRSGSSDKGIATWENPMKYWFMITPNRIMGIIKVDAYYASFYGGFLTTAATKEQMPYPMYISGSCQNDTPYTTTASHVGCGCFPETANQRSPAIYSTAFFDSNLNVWRDYTLQTHWEPGPIPGSLDGNMFDYCTLWEEDINGNVFLVPVYVQSRGYNSTAYGQYVYQNCYVAGQMEGIFILNGTDKVAETIVTIDTIDYILIPNYYRTGRSHYCAFRLD